MAVNITSADELLPFFKIPFIPQKVAFDPNCEVFEEGDRLCRPLQKQLIVEEDCREEIQTPHSLWCIEPSCKVAFNSLQSCEVHYACSHRYVCVECKRVFPSQPMLDLHIQDNHSPHGVAHVDCENYLYRCFIPLCTRQFTLLEERNEHLIRDHKYPANFKFGVLRGTKVDPEKMDTSCPSDNVSAAKYKPKAPHSICFGHGSTKAFKRKDVTFLYANNRASCFSQKQELENNICMTELHDVLP